MIKFFIIASLFLAIVLIVFAYRYKGTPEYEENFFGMKVMFVAYLIIGTMMIMYQPEIKSLVITSKNEKPISINVTEEKGSSAIKNETEIGVVLRKSIWVKYEDLDDFVSALKREDVAYLDRMLYEGRAYVVRMDARAMRTESGIYTGIVFITFIEGEYTNQQGYTIKKCVPTEEEYMTNKGKMYIPDSKR